MKCQNCGEDNRFGLKFCENCGEPLEVIKETHQDSPQSQGVTCLNCGAENREGVRFCEECGNSLIVKEETDQEHEILILETSAITEEVIPEIQHEEKPKEKKKLVTTPKELQFCPRCGFENQAEAQFCEHCGELLTKPPIEKVEVSRDQLKKCPRCGSENKKTVSACYQCGYLFDIFKENKPARKREIKEKQVGSRMNFGKNTKLALPKLTSRTVLWIIISIAVVFASYFIVSSIVIKLNRQEARQLANAVVYSTHPEFSGVDPYVEHTKEGRQYFSTFSYSKNFTGTLEGGGEVAYTQYIVIKVNRSKGDFQILSAY